MNPLHMCTDSQKLFATSHGLALVLQMTIRSNTVELENILGNTKPPLLF